MTREPITTKQQMYELLWQGLLGNHFLWESYAQWIASPGRSTLRDHYSLRFGRELGAPWEYKLSLWQAVKAADRWMAKVPMSDISVVTMPRAAVHVMNAELSLLDDGLYLYYSTVPDVMRRSLAAGGRSAERIQALTVLHHFCDPSSVDDLLDLTELYPGHSIELTAFNQDVGVYPHRNTVIWEVRRY